MQITLLRRAVLPGGPAPLDLGTVAGKLSHAAWEKRVGCISRALYGSFRL